MITISDFVRIRWSLLFLVLAVLAAIATATISRGLVSRAQAEQRQLTEQQRTVRARLGHAQEEEQELRKKISLYQQLLDHGIVGQEERLGWVEQIARIKTARRLLDVQYELSPQKSMSDAVLPGGAVAGDYEFMASTMRLQMSLLHEDDLLGFITDLRRAVHAHLLVRDCAVERTAPIGAGGVSAQLKATCTIDWVTLREKRQ
jgi:type II secretory pathway pseudopilin PulG